MKFAGILDNLRKVRAGAVDAYGEGREDNRRAFINSRLDQNLDADPIRWESMMGQNRTITMVKEALGKLNPEHKEALRQMGMGLSNDPYTRAGQMIGHVGADLTQDRSREVYWLLNAAQAVGNVVQEAALKKANPDIFNKMDDVLDEAKNKLYFSNKEAAERLGAIDGKSGRLRKGYALKDEGDEKVIQKRRFEPGHSLALQIPAGLAINTGIGLMNPFGGQEGYYAVVPSEEDPNKTSNALLEVGSKYILGRTGNLLPWEEFKQVRPDVSKDEYMRYKAFKFDKDMDVNPFDDGLANPLPGGVVKYNNDGIHGAEVQFLGRSLPLSTGILPTAMAIGGSALGAKYGKRPIRDAFIGGMSGSLGGMGIGNAIEDERRRRNQAENERDRIDTID